MGFTTEYWRLNKERILSERQRKYNEDPAYRAAALERSREYRRKKREEAGVGGSPEIVIDGKIVESYKLDEIPEEYGLTKVKLKYFQKQGYIPPALVSRPSRLYTKSQVLMIDALQKFLDKHRSVLRNPTVPAGVAARTELEKIVAHIHQNWKA